MKKIGFILLLVAILLPASLLIRVEYVGAVSCDTVRYPQDAPENAGELKYPDTRNNLVSCGQYTDCTCEISDIFVTILRVYNFLTLRIALPLAALIMAIGGILIFLSGGPKSPDPVTKAIAPNIYTKGVHMVTWSIICVILVFGAWLIVDVLLKAIGYTGNWSSF